MPQPDIGFRQTACGGTRTALNAHGAGLTYCQMARYLGRDHATYTRLEKAKRT